MVLVPLIIKVNEICFTLIIYILQEYKAGRSVGLSGRDLFTFNPDMVGDDDDEADDGGYEKDENAEVGVAVLS